MSAHFDTESLASAYEAETGDLLRRRTIVACVLVIVLVPLYSIADHFLYPALLTELACVRLLCVACTAIVLRLLQGRLGKKQPSVLAMAMALSVTLTAGGLAVYVVGVDSPYYFGLSLAIVCVALLLPLSVQQVAILAAVIAIAYTATGLVRPGGITSVPLFLFHIAFMLTAATVALVGLSMSENLRRREFLMRLELEHVSREKSGLISALKDKTEMLEALNQDMEDLLYVASHDLRAPLINVQGFTREVQLGLTDVRTHCAQRPETEASFSDLSESLQFILSAVARMDGLIGSLLNVSRIATRTHPTEHVALQPMVEKIIESFRYQLDQKQIRVDLNTLPTVCGDAVRLSQVFSNLIDNAVKYMGDEQCRAIEIGVHHGAQNGTATLFVRDSGPGIPAEHQETIFRLFRRLSSEVPGEGLGLTMVRKIVEKHGGRIWVESLPGKGATFYFTLRNAQEALHAL